MAAQIGPLFSAKALSHPAFDPLRPWLQKLGERPDCEALNGLAKGSAAAVATLSGHPVRFCEPGSSGAGQYEQRIYDTGQVQTRAANLHDLFNALVWIAFPRTKATINARHVARLKAEGTQRGPLRDLLTLIDEGGVIVACETEACAEIETLIKAFRWQELFWERRTALLSDCRFVLTGHNAYEKALSPYAGITCKSLFVPAPRDRLTAPLPQLVAWLDARAAEWIACLPEEAAPRQMAPLPVFGYPGWLPESSDPGFYVDRRWFRARRKLERPA